MRKWTKRKSSWSNLLQLQYSGCRPTPSALEGMARVFDLGGVFSTRCVHCDQRLAPLADMLDGYALRSDWVRTGQDIQTAMKQMIAALDDDQVSKLVEALKTIETTSPKKHGFDKAPT